MTTTAAQQVSLDNPAKIKKEPMYQVVLDALALTTCYPSFLIIIDFKIDKKRYIIDMEVFREILQICPKLSNQEFDALLSEEEIVSFIKELGHKGDTKSVTDMVVDQIAQILWEMFYKKNVDFVELFWEDFTFQIENKDTKKQEKMYYPRFTKAIIHHFITKDKSISMRNKIFMPTAEDDSILGPMRFVSKANDYQVYEVPLPEVMTSQKMRDSPAYKTYLAFATGAASPKKARKYKKLASLSRKRTLVIMEEEEPEPAKKKKTLATTDRSKGIHLLFEAALLEDAQVKKALKRSQWETTIHQVSGSGDSGDEANIQGDDEDVQDSDDDPQQADDERTNSDNQETNNDEEEFDNEFVHTPEDYVPTNDETNDESNDFNEEEYDKIDKELYGDVNVRLTDDEQDDKVLRTSQLITILVSIMPKHTVFNPSKTITTAPTTTITSLLSSLFPNIHQLTPIPTSTNTDATTSIPTILESETPNAIHLRLSDLEKKVKELKNVDHSLALLLKIKSKVSNTVKESLRTILDDGLYKALKKHADIIKEFLVPVKIVKRLTHQYLPQQSTEKITEDIWKIKMEHSFNKSPKHRALYQALIELILEDEDVMDEGVADKLKKRKPDDADQDEGFTAGSDRGLKRQRTSKGAETYKKMSTSKDSFKGKSPSTSSKSSKSKKYLKDQGEDLGKTSEQPNDENVSKYDWYKKSRSDTLLDLEWNKGKLVDDRPEQNWLNDMAKATKPPLTFDELMYTPIDFSAFAIIHLKIDNLTRELLVGPVYNMLKEMYKSYVELDYTMEECYHALSEQLDWNNPKGHRCPYDLTKPLLATLIQARVKDLQVGVESYQKKLNLTKTRTQDVDISRKPAYTTLSNPQGVIYEDKLKQKRFMRADELHKFSDGTLILVRDTPSQMLHDLHLGYNKATRRRQWTRLD
nr:hypothetical protein [Tanacetum cinerariifolium]